MQSASSRIRPFVLRAMGFPMRSRMPPLVWSAGAVSSRAEEVDQRADLCQVVAQAPSGGLSRVSKWPLFPVISACCYVFCTNRRIIRRINIPFLNPECHPLNFSGEFLFGVRTPLSHSSKPDAVAKNLWADHRPFARSRSERYRRQDGGNCPHPR